MNCHDHEQCTTIYILSPCSFFVNLTRLPDLAEIADMPQRARVNPLRLVEVNDPASVPCHA